MHNKDYYLNLRRNYEPNNLRLIFILESPPKSGKYFYDNTGSVSEPLFREMMRVVNFDPKDKEVGLREFKKRGLLIVDSVYEPVDHLSTRDRNKKISEHFIKLKIDLENLLVNKTTPIVLVKANICRLLESILIKNGFNVINNNEIIPFPTTGWQKLFHSKLSDVLKQAKLSI